MNSQKKKHDRSSQKWAFWIFLPPIIIACTTICRYSWDKQLIHTGPGVKIKKWKFMGSLFTVGKLSMVGPINYQPIIYLNFIYTKEYIGGLNAMGILYQST